MIPSQLAVFFFFLILTKLTLFSQVRKFSYSLSPKGGETLMTFKVNIEQIIAVVIPPYTEKNLLTGLPCKCLKLSIQEIITKLVSLSMTGLANFRLRFFIIIKKSIIKFPCDLLRNGGGG